MLTALEKLDRGLEKVSSYSLIVCVLLMLASSVAIIVLSWAHISYPWADPFVRHLVFLSTFLGGIIATGRGTHIGIDIIKRMLEAKNREDLAGIINIIIYLACFIGLVWLAKASSDFMKIELKYGKPVFFGISSGVLVGIIPMGLGLMAYRYFYFFVRDVTQLFSKANRG